MPLPIGTWKMNMNGKEGDFIIHGIQEGGFTASLFAGEGFAGFWDEGSQTITFALSRTLGGPAAVFKGYLLRTPENPAPGRDVLVTLTGFVQVNGKLADLPGTSRRNVFGWFAQITEVV